MGFYKYFAFIGAGCLAVDLFPFFAPLSVYLRGVAAFCALFGACYFLIKTEEYRYGIVMVLMCVACQPFLDLGITGLMFYVMEIFCIVIFSLTGILAGRNEKQEEINHAKAQAEIEALQRHEAAIRRRMNS